MAIYLHFRCLIFALADLAKAFDFSNFVCHSYSEDSPLLPDCRRMQRNICLRSGSGKRYGLEPPARTPGQ